MDDTKLSIMGVCSSVSASVDCNYHPKTSDSEPMDLDITTNSNMDLSDHDDHDANDSVTFDGSDNYAYDYDDDNDDDEYYVDAEDDYSTLQSQFDNLGVPPGIEASLPWLNEAGASASTTSLLPHPSDPTNTNSAESNCHGGQVFDRQAQNQIIHNFHGFKQFDTVSNFSDHYYTNFSDAPCGDPRAWAKRIQDEWKILEKNLPDMIYVRVAESRMQLLRAVIMGAAGTPYHDGLFVFDCLFPSTYPYKPPMVFYESGGLRLNPNLYGSGKVCLSLLGTWSGQKNEKWIPEKSTMLQVLVSIQALILNAEPYFNEPGYETRYGSPYGKQMSRKYNDEVFIFSLKTMIYTLRRPPKYFEDLVVGHFHTRAHDILIACKAYLDGAAVGSVAVKDGVAEINEAEERASNEFKESLKKMINFLVTNFNKFGLVNCSKFLIPDDGQL